MRRLTKPLLLSLLTFGLLLPGTMLAQTPTSSPGAAPVSDSPAWKVTDVREVEVDGEPVALSPDGQWLAGLGPGENEVCAWDIETLTPACADVGGKVEPFIGGTRLAWSPDSSAFAFASGSMRTLEYGDVFVFEVDTGELTQLTTSSANERATLYLGASWTNDSQQVVFAMSYGIGSELPRPEIGRVDRTGGEVEVVSLPEEWPDEYNVMTPPFVGPDGSISLAIDSKESLGGIWSITPDGSSPEHLAEQNGNPPITSPMIVSMSPDGRYLNVVSISGFARLIPENTFFLLDTETGELRPLVNEGNVQLIAFAPDNSTGLMAQETGGKTILHTINLETGEIAPVDGSPEVSNWLKHLPTWAENDVVFLPGGDGGTLVTLELAS